MSDFKLTFAILGFILFVCISIFAIGFIINDAINWKLACLGWCWLFTSLVVAIVFIFIIFDCFDF